MKSFKQKQQSRHQTDAQKKISMNSGHFYLQKVTCLDLFSFSSFTPLDEILKGLQAEFPKHVELRDMTYQWYLASNTLLPGFEDVILSPPTNRKSGLRFVEEMFYEICSNQLWSCHVHGSGLCGGTCCHKRAFFTTKVSRRSFDECGWLVAEVQLL